MSHFPNKRKIDNIEIENSFIMKSLHLTWIIKNFINFNKRYYCYYYYYYYTEAIDNSSSNNEPENTEEQGRGKYSPRLWEWLVH